MLLLWKDSNHYLICFALKTNCIRCTIALNRRIRATGKTITADQIANFSMEHPGHCYRNSNLAPSSAEEHQAVMAAKDLLLDANGEYVGDDKAIFGVFINADNDTRAPKAFIRWQNKIIGEAADNLAEHAPDRGHVLKCHNNAMFKLKAEDRSLNGVHALSNLRIKSLTHDLKEVLICYEKGRGDPAAKKACLDQLPAIVTHHCGRHHLCKNEKWCTYLKIKKQHPDWTHDQIEEKAAEDTLRPHKGKYMSLSDDGIAKLTKRITDRFNYGSIDKYAKGGCSNLSENFWNMVTKFSEGKRLNEDHTDLWEVNNKLAFCRKGEGNIEKTHDQVSDKLGLHITTPELKHQVKATKKRESDQKRQSSPEYKSSRLFAKMAKDHKMGQVDSRKAHRSDKVPLEESAKSSIPKDDQSKNQRSSPTCSICKQSGHSKAKCQMPPERKRPLINFANLELDELRLAEEYGVKARKRQKKLELLSIEDWV